MARSEDASVKIGKSRSAKSQETPETLEEVTPKPVSVLEQVPENVPAKQQPIAEAMARANEEARNLLGDTEEMPDQIQAMIQEHFERTVADIKKKGIPTQNGEFIKVSPEDAATIAAEEAERARLTMLALVSDRLTANPMRKQMNVAYEGDQAAGTLEQVLSVTDDTPVARELLDEQDMLLQALGVNDVEQAIEYVGDILRNSSTLTPEQKALLFGRLSRSTQTLPQLEAIQRAIQKGGKQAVLDLFNDWIPVLKAPQHQNLTGNENYKQFVLEMLSKKLDNIARATKPNYLATFIGKDWANAFQFQIVAGIRNADGEIVAPPVMSLDELVSNSADNWTKSQPEAVRQQSDDFVARVLTKERMQSSLDPDTATEAALAAQDLEQFDINRQYAVSLGRGRFAIMAKAAREQFRKYYEASGGLAQSSNEAYAEAEAAFQATGLTQEAREYSKIKRQIRQLKQTDPDKAEELNNELEAMVSDYPGLKKAYALYKAAMKAYKERAATAKEGEIQQPKGLTEEQVTATQREIEQELQEQIDQAKATIERINGQFKKKVDLLDNPELLEEWGKAMRSLRELADEQTVMKAMQKVPGGRSVSSFKDPVISIYESPLFVQPPFNVIQPPLFPENPPDKLPTQVVWDGDVFDQSDTRMQGPYNSTGKSVLRKEELATANKIDTPGRARLMLNYLRRIVGDNGTVVPIIRKAEEIFGNNYGSTTLASYDGEEGQAYLNSLLKYLDDPKAAAYVILHEMSHGLDKGRILPRGPQDRQPTVFQGITGDADPKFYDPNNPLVATVRREAIALSEKFRGPMDARPKEAQAELSQEENLRYEAYKKMRMTDRELTADAIAAVLQNPSEAMSVAPTTTRLVLEMLPTRHPNMAKALRQFYSAKDIPTQIYNSLTDKTKESILEFGDRQQKREQEAKPSFVTTLVRDFVDSAAAVRSAVSKFVGRPLTREENARFDAVTARANGVSALERSLVQIITDGRQGVLKAGGTDEDINAIFQLAAAASGDNLRVALLDSQEAAEILSTMTNRNPDVMTAVRNMYLQLHNRVNQQIEEWYNRSNLGPVGSAEALERKKQWQENLWVAIGKAGEEEAARTGALKSEKQAVGFAGPVGDVLQNTIEAAARLQRLSDQYEAVREINKLSGGKMVHFGDKQKPGYTRPLVGFVDGEIKPVGWVAEPMALFLESNTGSGSPLGIVQEALTNMVRPATRLAKDIRTKMPWFQMLQVFREVGSTGAMVYLTDGVQASMGFVSKFSKGAKDLIFRGKGLHADMSRALVSRGREGLTQMLQERIDNLNALKGRTEPGAIEARRVLQDQITNIQDVLAGYEAGGFMQPGEGIQTGVPGTIRTAEEFARMRALDADPSIATFGEKALRSSAGKQLGGLARAYSDWMTSMEMLAKVTAAQNKAEILRRRGMQPEQLQSVVDKASANLMKREEDYAQAYKNWNNDRQNPDKERLAKNALSARDSAREVYEQSRDSLFAYQALIAQAAQRAGTPDIRVRGRLGGKLDSWFMWYSIGMKELQRGLMAASEAWSSGTDGKKRLAALLAVPVAMDAARRIIMEGMFSEDERIVYETAISPYRRMYSMDFPLGVIEQVDDEGKLRLYAAGIGLPVPDFFRPIFAAYQGAKSGVREAEEGALAATLGGIKGATGAFADYVLPSLTPVVDVGVATAMVAAGENPPRGLSPFSRQRVIPEGATVDRETRQAALIDYLAQRIGINSVLPKLSNDAPNSHLPGALRNLLFVDDGGLVNLGIRAREYQTKEVQRRADAIRAGDIPEDADDAEIIRALSERSKSAVVRTMTGLGPRSAGYLAPRIKEGSSTEFALESLLSPSAFEAVLDRR
jgi:hypothetical protein